MINPFMCECYTRVKILRSKVRDMKSMYSQGQVSCLGENPGSIVGYFTTQIPE